MLLARPTRHTHSVNVSCSCQECINNLIATYMYVHVAIAIDYLTISVEVVFVLGKITTT